MAMIRTYRDLVVWQKSMVLAKGIYRGTRALPNAERYGLCSQLRRAAVSIPSNIAEGHGRGGPGDYERGLDIAMGSLCEVETQLQLCLDLEFLENESVHALLEQCHEIRRMLFVLRKRINEKRI